MSGKFDWKKTLSTVAPTLATALGGPLAGMAVSVAGKALGLSDPDEDAIASAVLSGSPESLVALKQANQEFEVRLKELDIELEKVNAADRNSARELARDKGIQPQIVLSTVFVGAFAGLLWLLFTGKAEGLTGQNLEISYMLLGILSAGMTQVMNFWFGSSAGSKQKDAVAITQRSR